MARLHIYHQPWKCSSLTACLSREQSEPTYLVKNTSYVFSFNSQINRVHCSVDLLARKVTSLHVWLFQFRQLKPSALWQLSCQKDWAASAPSLFIFLFSIGVRRYVTAKAITQTSPTLLFNFAYWVTICLLRKLTKTTRHFEVILSVYPSEMQTAFGSSYRVAYFHCS